MNSVTTTNNVSTTQMSGSDKASIAKAGVLVAGALVGLFMLVKNKYSFKAKNKDTEIEANPTRD